MTAQTMRTPQRRAGIRPALTGLAIIFLAEFILRDVLLPIPASSSFILLATAVEWLLALLLLIVWIPRVEGKRLSSIGVGPFKWRYLWLGAFAYIVATLASMLLSPVLSFFGLHTIQDLQPSLKVLGFPVLVSLFITGTIVEEIFYRGYLIERLTFLTGRLGLAAGISWLVFSLVHLRFFGLGPTIGIGLLSAALVLLYVKERSLWPCVVCHGLNGALAYLIFPLVFR